MSYLIDTCVLSEIVKPRPEPCVIDWFAAVNSDALFISALTLGEILRGVERLPPGRKRERIGAWLEMDLPQWFGERVLSIDAAVSDEWGRLAGLSSRTLPAVDALIAATALRHRLTLVTRNLADFAGTGVVIVNPWDSA
ncbi:MAG TPA: type II toxin-antitoxin system VapC family toxin [Caulobacteraceae bacterium]|nr:type II toxin-antitoxin system VapC family toxin [Caulobacteraceae bacterium]